MYKSEGNFFCVSLKRFIYLNAKLLNVELKEIAIAITDVRRNLIIMYTIVYVEACKYILG